MHIEYDVTSDGEKSFVCDKRVVEMWTDYESFYGEERTSDGEVTDEYRHGVIKSYLGYIGVSDGNPAGKGGVG